MVKLNAYNDIKGAGVSKQKRCSEGEKKKKKHKIVENTY